MGTLSYLIVKDVRVKVEVEKLNVFVTGLEIGTDLAKLSCNRKRICSRDEWDRITAKSGDDFVLNYFKIGNLDIINDIVIKINSALESLSGDENHIIEITKIGDVKCEYYARLEISVNDNNFEFNIHAQCASNFLYGGNEASLAIEFEIRDEVTVSFLGKSKVSSLLNYKIDLSPIARQAENFFVLLSNKLSDAINAFLPISLLKNLGAQVTGTPVGAVEGNYVTLMHGNLSFGFAIENLNINLFDVNITGGCRLTYIDGELVLDYELNGGGEVDLNGTDFSGNYTGPFEIIANELNVIYEARIVDGDARVSSTANFANLQISLGNDPAVSLNVAFLYTTTMTANGMDHSFENFRVLNIGGVEDINFDNYVFKLNEIGEDAFARLKKLMVRVIKWIAQQGSELGSYLAGIAESAFETIEEVLEKLDNHVTVEIIFNERNWGIRQIILRANQDIDIDTSLSGLSLTGTNYRPVIVLNLEGQNWVALGLEKVVTTEDLACTLSTDLWLTPNQGTRRYNGGGSEPFIAVTATAEGDSIVPFALVGKKARFFKRLHQVGGVYTLEELQSEVEAKINKSKLPILSGFNQGGVAITPKTLKVQNKVLRQEIEATIKFSDDYSAKANLDLTIDLDSFRALLSGDKVEVIGKEGEENQAPKRFLGLKTEFKGKKYINHVEKTFVQFLIDFTDGDPRLTLSKDTASLRLVYDDISNEGKGFVFNVNDFSLGRSGIDLDAKVNNSAVRLGGVDMPFRFDEGSLSIKRSKIQGFSMAASGNLPPDLVGDAKATVVLQLGADSNDNLEVKAATGKLEGTGEPLFCEGTQFRTQVDSLGFKFVRDNGYHFYFTVTGNVTFSPRNDSLTGGLMKSLEGFKINVQECPLTTDIRVLAKHIDFQVKLNPPMKTNLFNIFKFELRGFGFHPESEAFDGDPAVCISGQIEFVEIGDVMKPKIDFHNLWIAPPANDDVMPRFKCGGLGVDLQLGSAVRVAGKAIAVDGSLPGLDNSNLPSEVIPKGFVASGSLEISGWAPMSANMAFLELHNKKTDEKKHAFYFYIQQTHISTEIPTPVGTIYLREVGFGFGFRYTLAGLAKADEVNSPGELVKVLDEVAKYQGDLHKFKSWMVEFEGSRFTLALRGMFSVASASSGSDYNEKKEKNLPNPLLFDIVAALRSDLTFLMTARAWLCYNYADWVNESDAEWKSKPGFIGYLYISVPRREFLGRFVAYKNMPIGRHPVLAPQLRKAIQSSKASATLYIRPGLFHFELGWPYELEYTIDYGKSFKMTCSGGLVQRVNNEGFLQGVAFRCVGRAEFGGKVGGRRLGASAYGLANFGLEAKMISFIAFKRFGDSLFYAQLAIDIAIRFRVRVWLEFKIFRKRIRLSAGFSLNLAISAAIEVAISPKSIGGRANVSIRVKAFGRSLSVRVGLKFNESALVEARKRVQRYMSLGLGMNTPEPSAGLMQKKADEQLQQSAENHQQASKPLNEDTKEEGKVFTNVGEDIGATDFWAVLFPTDGGFIMTLVPRKGFYAAPEVEYTVNTTKGIRRFEPKYGLLEPSSETGVKYSYNDKFTVSEDAGETLDLNTLNMECFVVCENVEGTFCSFEEGVDLSDKSVKYRDPGCFNCSQNIIRQGENKESNAKELASANQQLDSFHPVKEWYIAIEERRSAVIASIASSAEWLANEWNGGDIDLKAGTGEVDCRAMGLTFFVPQTYNFNDSDNSEPIDITNILNLKTKSEAVCHIPSVRILNPPSRHFERQNPRLAKQSIAIFSGGIGIDFDLEPEWKNSETAYEDPEYLLKHYRVERRIFGLSNDPPMQQFTIKPADTVDYSGDEQTYIRPKYQIVDNLNDLSPAQKARILASAPGCYHSRGFK